MIFTFVILILHFLVTTKILIFYYYNCILSDNLIMMTEKFQSKAWEIAQMFICIMSWKQVIGYNLIINGIC